MYPTLYVSGGTDGNVLVYSFNLATKVFSGPATIQLIAGGANADANGIGGNVGYLGPQTSGLALDPTGRYLVALNMQNDSLSVVDTTTNAILVNGYDLRPYNTGGAQGAPGGEEPYGVAISSDGKRAYISSIRDREVDVVDISNAPSGTVSVIARIPVAGSPNNVTLKPGTGELFVAQDNSDQVAVIDTVPTSPSYNTVTHVIDAIAPPGTFPPGAPRWTGAATNNVALSPDGNTLYVTNGGANDVAVVPLVGPTAYQVEGLIPTAWYPTTVTPSANGAALYVFNSKSDPGNNALHQTTSVNSERYTKYLGSTNAAREYGGDQYVFQLEQSGFLTAPLAAVADNLPTLTAQVAANNGWTAASSQPSPTMQFLQGKIQHVIYIVKENRTFDQMLGDLTNGANADPALTVFGKVVTPNFHRLSIQFVTLDNFFCSGEVSGNGWPWSTAARETDWNEKNIPMDYTFGYGSGVTRSNAPYGAEGQNANVSVGYNVVTNGAYDPNATVALRTLEGGGYTYSDTTTYTNDGKALPGGAQQEWTAAQALIPYTDSCFHGFDNAYPDAWRFEEFQREFNTFVANGKLPNLVLLRYMHDHMGNFGSTTDAGTNFPEAQQADNDYAVGATVDMLAHSPYAGNTLVIVVEDDAQDGPDHMDAHRSTAYVVGPYVKQGAVVSTRYSTVNAVRTIEDVLGLQHLNLDTAYQPAMDNVFNINQSPAWTYHHLASSVLGQTSLILSSLYPDEKTEYAEGSFRPTHSPAWWAHETRGFDFTSEDRVPAQLFNQVLWDGLKPGQPYPTTRSGLPMRHD